MTPEKRVQNKIIEYLKSLQKLDYPIYFERRQAGGFSYKKGLPDLYVVYNGIHIEIEVKKPTGELSSMQIKWKNYFESINVIWICIKDVNELKELFINLMENKNGRI